MVTSLSLSRALPRSRSGLVVGLTLGAAALAVGALTTLQPLAAVALVVGVAIVLVVAANVDALPVFLVFTMFVSSLSLGPGLAIGRLAGPMALAVLAFYVLDRGANQLRPNLLLGVVFLYGLWTLTSVYWADDSGLVYTATFSYLIAIAYMLTFAVLVRRSGQVLAVFATFAVGSLLFGIASFAAFYASSESERSAGLVGDPNFFAVYQVLALPPTLVLAAGERRPGRRLGYLAIVGVIILSVVSSLSRTGLVALTAVTLATLIVPWRIFFSRASQKLTYFFMLVVASGVAVAAGSASFVARAQSILDPGGAAGDRGAGRLDLWHAAIHGWQDHPWVGLGASNFQAHALDLLQTTPGVNTRASYVHAGREVHNAYLEELVGLGVVGLGLFVLVLAVSAWYFVAAFRRARAAGEPLLERLALALLVSLVGFALSAIFLSNQLSRALWILVGLALALDVMTRRLPTMVTAAAGLAGRGEWQSYDRGVREPVAEQERRAAPSPLNVAFLEQLVAAYGPQFPERADEWGLYLAYLREFAADDGVLPERLEGLVLDAFGDLIARERVRR
jgi:O-antigen ligase